MTDEYEVYPGHTADMLAADMLSRSSISLESFCKNERINPTDLPRYVKEVLIEWCLKGEWHSTRRDAMNHLINHIRIKAQHEQQNKHTSAGRGSVAVYADRYSELENAADAILFQSADRQPSQND